jgi:hypothetical protein
MVLIVRTDLNLNKVQYKVFDIGVSSLIPFYKVKNSLIIFNAYNKTVSDVEKKVAL